MEEETLMQRLHELKLALDAEKSLRQDCIAENELLLAELNETKLQIDIVKKSQENEIRCLKEKIQELTNDYETEKLGKGSKIVELEELLKTAHSEKLIVHATDEYDKAVQDLVLEKQLRIDLEEENCKLKEEIISLVSEKNGFEQKLNEAMKMYEEVQGSLEIKKEDTMKAQNALKEIQEDKALLEAQVELLKVGPVGDVNRGNSLFKEVEDNRKKLSSAYSVLKNKYLVIKNIVTSKNQEISRLKGEISSLKMRDHGFDQDMKTSNCKMISSLENRVKELESLVHLLEKRKESPEIVTISDGEVSQLQWVHTIVNQARNEARKTIADYQKISSDSLGKSAALRSAELEVRNLKVEMLRKDGRIQELELMMAELKSQAKENIPLKNLSEEDSIFMTKSANKTVRFADDALEETC